MSSKQNLMVFSRREIAVVLLLFLLLVLLSFTVGLKLGRGFGLNGMSINPDAVVNESVVHGAGSHEVGKRSDAGQSVAAHDPADNTDLSSTSAAGSAAKQAEDKGDHELAKELEKSKLSTGKNLAMSYPKERKRDAGLGSKVTLQVGAYRTVSEATEQVQILKREGLDGFYWETELPGKGTWYRVGIGVFNTKDEAAAQAKRWESQHQLPSYMVQKISEN